MKRLKSNDDLASHGEKGFSKNWVKRDESSSLHRSSSHRNFYYKPDSGKKGLPSSSSRYDWSEDARESARPVKKQPDYDGDSYDRRKGYDRYSVVGERGISSCSPQSGYGTDRIHRSESFSGSRKDFPKRFRSERDRSRREGSISSWKRFGRGKDNSEKVSSPQGLSDAKSQNWSKDAKSPPWSKDSGSEQSKSIEVKNTEELQTESGNNSDMEEGELEPDPEPVPVLEPLVTDQASIGLNPNSDNLVEDKSLEDQARSMSEEKVKFNQISDPEEKKDVEMSEATQNVVKDVDELGGCLNNSPRKSSKNEDVIITTAENDVPVDVQCAIENCNDALVNSITLDEDKGKAFEVKADNNDLPRSLERVVEGNGETLVTLSFIEESDTQKLKDKGKSIAVSPPIGTNFAEDGLGIKNESMGLFNCRENDMDGPSSRGFDLFFVDPVKKLVKADQTSLSKPMNEKVEIEPLELSLSLPNVLFPSSSENTVQAPGSPSNARSFQSFSSFRTSSDAFTASMSFSHNPSCSLTVNSVENCEKSVGSRPIFQGVKWQGQSSNENKQKDGPMYQGNLSNGNGVFHHSQTSQGISSGKAVEILQHRRVAEGSSKLPIGLDRQLSFVKQLSGADVRHPSDVSSPSQSIRRDKQEKREPILEGGSDFVEPIIRMIVSEPIHVMAQRFNEMTAQSVACLKESVRELLVNPGKQRQLCGFQNALEKRSDITLEILLKSHRAQLEVLVALKTGLQDFLHRSYDISSSHLTEIFLNLRCRNVTCQSSLPVEECDCKICMQKNGFCNACMCLVCSKFDNASNTCSWVGCDVCLHWCHADCGLRESYIRNGRSATRARGTTEMQFHCVGCDLPSEMFGFAKEVFQKFVKGWTAETLFKELEYVRRIFCASKDDRGKQLHDVAIQMLTRLANKCDLQEVQSCIMGFLTKSDSFMSTSTLVIPEKDIAKKKQGEGSSGIAGPSHEPAWLKALYSDKAPQSVKFASLLPTFDFESDKHISSSDLQRSAQKEPTFDELETVVRIKQAEAKMFQMHADDARREAEGLKRIANAKNEKLEEEYKARITKLRLAEAEEICRLKFEEFQGLERAHNEYLNMKTRMEMDIKNLLLKMEATKCNFVL